MSFFSKKPSLEGNLMFTRLITLFMNSFLLCCRYAIYFKGEKTVHETICSVEYVITLNFVFINIVYKQAIGKVGEEM